MQDKAILRLDTLGHTSVIWKLLVSNDKRYLISASADKTVRVWDIETKKEVRKFLGEISSDKGQIYAIALSFDDKYLAVAGYIDNFHIRIYDFKTGKLLKLLKSHTNTIFDLKFSKDNRYLVSGSADSSLNIWDVDNWNLKQTFNHHSEVIYGVDIFFKDGNYRIVSVGEDNKVNFYSLDRYIKSFEADDKLDNIVTSNEFIAVSGDEKKIYLFDLELNHLKSIETDSSPASLSFSYSGNYLLTGASSIPVNCNIYDTKTNFKKLVSFNGHENTVRAVAFLNDDIAITGGGDNKEIYFWDVKTAEKLEKIEGVGNMVFSVGIKDNLVGFGDKWTDVKGLSKLIKCFDLKKFKICEDIDFDDFKKIEVNYSNYSLACSKGGAYKYDDAVLNIFKDENIFYSITKDGSDGYEHRCYGFYKDIIISGACNGKLIAYNLDGIEIGSLLGHTGDNQSLAIEGTTLVSGNADQIIKLWNLQELEDGEKKINPYLSIFISKENEWIVWSESGYYVSSPKGDQYVGYHINRGKDKEASFFSSSKFFDELYRPDIIESIVEHKNEKKGIAFASQNKKVNHENIMDILPPKVNLLSEDYLVIVDKNIFIEFEVESQSDIKNIEIFVNGREVKKIEELHDVYKVELDVNESENHIQVYARNKYTLSEPAKIFVKREIINYIPRPNLYILSIGVSKYKNEDYNLKYPDKDAEAIVKIFKSQEDYLYNKVEFKLLTNQEATKDNILDALDWLDKEVTHQDVAILFLAGHGLNDHKNAYYFLNHEVELDSLRKTGVKWIEFEDIIKTIPSKVLLFTDTCHAGNVMGSRRRDIIGAIKELTNTASGQVIMTATTDSSYALEDEEWEHGAFTKAIVEALDESKAYRDNEHKSITVKDLEHYIANRVKELTNGEQKPTTIIPESVPDFPIFYKKN